MPRAARKKSESGIYHIVLRGINRQSIFEDEEDKKRLLHTLFKYKEKCGFSVYAYCFMTNHVHLLMKTGDEPLEQIMRRVAGSYVYWYNKKYARIGNLFQDRFKSEPVETDRYFLTVVRYIHQNPVKANIVKEVLEYRWSSFHEYLDIEAEGITDRQDVLMLFHQELGTAWKDFIEFSKELNDDKCLEDDMNQSKLTDDELSTIIRKSYKIQADMIKNESRENMESILKSILEMKGVSTRQLARVTGVSANVIWHL